MQVASPEVDAGNPGFLESKSLFDGKIVTGHPVLLDIIWKRRTRGRGKVAPVKLAPYRSYET